MKNKKINLYKIQFYSYLFIYQESCQSLFKIFFFNNTLNFKIKLILQKSHI